MERGADPAALKQNRATAPSVADLAAAYLDTKATTKRPNALRDDRDMWRQIILPVLGARKVEAITARDIDQLHKSRQATPYRANRMLALLRHAFTLARRWGWRADNPCEGIDRFHEDRRERWLTHGEFARLSAALAASSNPRADLIMAWLQPPSTRERPDTVRRTAII